MRASPAALAAGLAVFALRRRFPWAWAAALAFAVTGAAALLASPFVAFFAGLLAGAPLAAFVTDSAARGIAAAGAVILAGVLWLFGLGLAAFGLALLPLLAVPARRGATSAPGRPAAAGGQ